MRNMIFLLVLFVANVVQAVTGFAGTLLAMPPAMMLIGVYEAKVILNIMAFLSCLILAVKNYRNIQWKILFNIIVYMAIGMFAGIWLFERLSFSLLLPAYGVMILLIALKKMFVKKEIKMTGFMLNGILLAAGVIHGMFVSGGALLVVYASAVLKDKENFRATVASVWVVLNTGLMISDILQGYMTSEVMKMTGISILPLFLAIYVGNKIHEKIDQKLFMKITYILLFASGVSILV
jgi:uncharacterized membrane protein YfcA